MNCKAGGVLLVNKLPSVISDKKSFGLTLLIGYLKVTLFTSRLIVHMPGPFDNLKRALSVATIVSSPGLWKQTVHLGVGGLFAVGFDTKTENLVVVSMNGQSVIDCSTGQLIYRNREQDGFNNKWLNATRLDSPNCSPINMAGLYGGGLKASTSDGWSVKSFPIEWPETYYILEPPDSSIYYADEKWRGHSKNCSFFLLGKDRGESCAFGFSWSGKFLVLASTSDLFVWSRD